MQIDCIYFENKCSEELYEKLIAFLPEEKQARVKRFYRWQDAYRSLIGNIIVRYSILKKFNMKNEDIRFETNKYGKPYLLNHSDFHFNLSHSGKWVAFASDNQTVGIDVQKMKPIEMDIAKRFFSPIEYEDLMAQPEEKRNSYFFDLWTLKESYIKAVGQGLSLGLSTFSFRLTHNEIDFETEHQHNDFYFKQYDIDSDYKTAVCSSLTDLPEQVNIMSDVELFELFCAAARIV